MIRILIFSLAAIYWLTLFVLTHLPPAQVPVGRVNDKLAHIVSYFLLSTLLLIANHIRRKPFPIWSVLAVVLLYGIFDEQTQKLVGRSCSLADFIADATGAAIALLSFMLLCPRLRAMFPKSSELS